jgi:hypothetical protein
MAKPILKRPIGFEPSTTFQSDTQLFEAAIHAYSLLSSCLFKEGAPDTIPADAFTAEQLTETKKAYTAIISHVKNCRRALNPPIDFSEEDPVDSAYTILVQWYHVRARMDATRKAAPKESLKREREEEEERIQTPRFKEFEFRRHFNQDEWALQDEERNPTRGFDGPSPISTTIKQLLENKIFRGIQDTKTCVAEAHKFLASKPEAELLTAVVQELEVHIERIKRKERPSLYRRDGSIKLCIIHFSTLYAVTKILSEALG